jgi:peptide/nickel transport system permease protein
VSEAVAQRRLPVAAAFGDARGVIGLGLAVAVIAIILVGPHVAPYDPEEIGLGPAATGPSSAHPLGLDGLGRDVLSRFLNGGASVLVVPFVAVVLAFLLGGTLGMLGAYQRGRPDTVITRIFDLLLTVPPLLLVLVLIAGLGTSRIVLIVTVALVFAPRVGRVLRGATQAVVTSDYVAAAEARGERTTTILGREILPNIAAPAIADFALRITYAIIFVATLNFLGLGVQPPNPDWGLMISDARGYLATAPLAAVAPAAAIAALSVAFNLVADSLGSHLARDTDRRTL